MADISKAQKWNLIEQFVMGLLILVPFPSLLVAVHRPVQNVSKQPKRSTIFARFEVIRNCLNMFALNLQDV